LQLARAASAQVAAADPELLLLRFAASTDGPASGDG
jgi:hypothetical protein